MIARPASSSIAAASKALPPSLTDGGWRRTKPSMEFGPNVTFRRTRRAPGVQGVRRIPRVLRHVSPTLQALLCRLRRARVAHFVAGARWRDERFVIRDPRVRLSGSLTWAFGAMAGRLPVEA